METSEYTRKSLNHEASFLRKSVARGRKTDGRPRPAWLKGWTLNVANDYVVITVQEFVSGTTANPETRRFSCRL